MAEGGVIWITGVSGVGKTTAAKRLVERLRAEGACAVLVDGDLVRAAVADPFIGYDRASRLTNAYRVVRVCRMLAAQDVIAVAATVSLFHEIHDRMRAGVPRYREILLTAPTEALLVRNPGGWIHKARDGAARDVVGVDQRPEVPKFPHLVIDTGGGDVDAIVDAIFADARAALGPFGR